MSNASDLRKLIGNREFTKSFGGTQMTVRVYAERGDVTVYVHSRTGFGGSGRREDLGQVSDEVLNLLACDPDGGALADALVEAGLDDGAANVIRG
jgi:hypothetical protein